MRTITKIILGATLLFLIIGVASATDIIDIFQAPSSLHALGTSSYVDEQGHNIMIVEYSDDNYDLWFENDTEAGYVAQKYNDTCYIGADDENDCYILEIVEKEGTKYIIGSWTPNGVDDAKIIQNNLEEFNKLNNLNPLEV
ncbi:hypothetical protein [Methanobrevibacter sp.]|uniref:hypothetical protein n=1 Tax=Methanobrevibacter sp. TaxID=66852 RepID=UPI00389045B3